MGCHQPDFLLVVPHLRSLEEGRRKVPMLELQVLWRSSAVPRVAAAGEQKNIYVLVAAQLVMPGTAVLLEAAATWELMLMQGERQTRLVLLLVQLTHSSLQHHLTCHQLQDPTTSPVSRVDRAHAKRR
jgi:hypothetical protein